MPPMDASITIVAYLALFTTVGMLFLFANLLLGRFLRPHNPNPQKLDIYECGEPTNVRFYILAMTFLVFDVEVAFLFPWATAFGKSVNLADERFQVAAVSGEGYAELTPSAVALYREMGISNPTLPPGANELAATADVKMGAQRFALFAALATENVHRIVAGMTLPNDASRALHERFGFTHVGDFAEVGYKFGRYWDVAWFQRGMRL